MLYEVVATKLLGDEGEITLRRGDQTLCLAVSVEEVKTRRIGDVVKVRCVRNRPGGEAEPEASA